MERELTLKVGDKAYYDSFKGMIPCKVIEIIGVSGLPSTQQSVRLKLTGKGAECCGWSPYAVGEIIETNGIHAVPRKAHYHGSCGIGRIRAYYVECE